MRHKTTYPYLLIFATLLCLMSLPKKTVETLQGTSIAALGPFLSQLDDIKMSMSHPSIQNLEQEILKLKLENQLLQNETAILKKILEDHVDSPTTKQSYQKFFSQQLNAIPAKVIFRSPASWNSSLWINVGEADNHAFDREIIAKNSPVIVGTSVVGVIDYVGSHQSRVRLITDSGLTPSVRALRGDKQRLFILDRLSRLLAMIKSHKGLFDDSLKHNNLIEVLEHAKEEIHPGNQDWYLAKGELHGDSKPLWRSNQHYLQGIGFNYDFPDEKGPARDLRTGKSMDPQSTLATMPIIQVHDLLVTTGMDGVFPPNLPVAEVTSIKLLKEGDYFYELEARPTAGNLDELSLVFVLPPSEFREEEQPSPLE